MECLTDNILPYRYQSGFIVSKIIDKMILNETMELQQAAMLNQGPASDPKSKLNISSFCTLSHLLACLICTGNSLSIVLLL